jgi:DNA-binding transcriptional MerR regulator
VPKDFKTWYAVHGEALNEKRRMRYKSDQEYRNRVLNASKQTRRKNKGPEDLAPTTPKRRQDAKKRAIFVYDGVVESPHKPAYFTLKALARHLGVPVETVKRWQRLEQLPKGTRIPGIKAVLFSESEAKAAINAASSILSKGVQTRATGTDPSRPSRWLVSFPDGRTEETDLFTIRLVAKALGRTPESIIQLENSGFFPRTPLRKEPRGRRFYSADMIEVAANSFGARANSIRGESNWEAIFAEIEQGWSQRGWIDAKLIGKAGGASDAEDQSEESHRSGLSDESSAGLG